MKNIKLSLSLILAGVLLLANLVWVAVYAQKPDGLTHIYFLDVGQGDAALIKLPDSRTILIDGGPSLEVASQIDALLPFWKREIDLVVLTHPHADHVTGLLQVARRFHIKEFLYNGSEYDTQTYKGLISYLQGNDINMKLAKSGMSYDFAPCRLDVLFSDVLGVSTEDPNDTSVVTQLTCNQVEVLLTGDISTKVENVLVDAGLISDVEVLKVGHQGSKTSSGDKFLDAASPELGVISVGRNSFGHPHQDVLERFVSRNIPIYRTDESGTITVSTDGVRYRVS